MEEFQFHSQRFQLLLCILQVQFSAISYFYFTHVHHRQSKISNEPRAPYFYKYPFVSCKNWKIWPLQLATQNPNNKQRKKQESEFTWCAYIVSYTRVQNTPEKYSGKTIAGSKVPLMAAHPNKAPQLNVRPRYAWGCHKYLAKPHQLPRFLKINNIKKIFRPHFITISFAILNLLNFCLFS